MKDNVRAAMLSAFAVPGLGQILQGRKLKGWILALLSIILLLILTVVFVLVFNEYFSLAPQLQVQWDGSVFIGCLQKRKVALLALGGAMIFLWAYSVLDALIYTESRGNIPKKNGN